MQIVIEIPNKDIPKHQEILDIYLHFIDGHIVDADGYGFAELPKGHGRLIDADKIEWYGCTTELNCPYKDRECKDCNRAECDKTQVDDIPTIIEADTESEG